MATQVVVVCPCYNEPTERIARTVESALATPGVDRVRLVDDGSTVAFDVPPGIEAIRRETNGGPSAALNTGTADLDPTDIICRLDIGDVFYPEPKARQIETVKAGAPAVCSWHFDPVRNRVHQIREDWHKLIYRDCQFSSTACVFTKAALDECGGFDESLRWTEDWRFCVAMHTHVGWTVFPEVTGAHGEFPGGHSDVSGDPDRKKRRKADRVRVQTLVMAMRSPDEYAHLYNEDWCRRHGTKPMKRPK